MARMNGLTRGMTGRMTRRSANGALLGAMALAMLGGGAARAQDTVTLGAVLPLSGASATIGEDQRRGIELAVEKVNAEGGVLGRKLAVAVEDSGGRAQSAIDAARKLVSVSKTPVVIGEYSSGNTIPVGQYLQREGVVHINPGSSSPVIKTIGDRSFSTIGLDDVAGKFTAEAVYGMGHRKAVFLAPNNAYGQGVYTETKAAFEALGGQVVANLLYTEGQSNYRRELQRIAAAKPDVIIYSGYGQEAATINREAFELGLSKTPWFGIYLSMCTADSRPETVEGQMGMEVNYVGPDGAWYRDAYQKKFGKEFATTFSGYTYDAVMMAAAAINKAGSAEPAKIRDALAALGDYAGATGPIAFDAQGQRKTQPYIVVSYKSGELKTAAK